MPDATRPMTIAGRLAIVFTVVGGAVLQAGVSLTKSIRERGVSIESRSLRVPPFRIESKGGAWEVSGLPPPSRASNIAVVDTCVLDPELGKLSVTLTEAADSATVSVWFAAENRERLTPFLIRIERGGDSILGWDVKTAFGAERPTGPNKTRVALWACSHADSIEDVQLLARVADHFWHNQELDSPPGSYNRLVKINLRLLEIVPHETALYGTTAWLLWSKWVSWKQDPKSMPDGKTKLDEALALLARGDKANPGDATFLLEAGTVLMPVVKHHRPDLAPTVDDYLRRAAEAATAGKIAVRARRTYAGFLFSREQYATARSWYRKLLEVAPNNEVARRRLRELRER